MGAEMTVNYGSSRASLDYSIATTERTITGSQLFNKKGQLVREKDGKGKPVWYVYNSKGLEGSVVSLYNDSAPTADPAATEITNISAYESDEDHYLVENVQFDPKGRVIAKWGNTYPVAYGYNEHDQLTDLWTLHGAADPALSFTTASTAIQAVGDHTAWGYHPGTGLLTSKEYADGAGPSYNYTIDGKLKTRTWAREANGGPLVTTYSYYGGNGETESLGHLKEITYSDRTTPNVLLSYNRNGQKQSVKNNVAGYGYEYSPLDGSLITEHITNYVVGTETVDKTYTMDYSSRDALNRFDKYELKDVYGIPMRSASYTYGDDDGLLKSITADGNTFTYKYFDGTSISKGRFLGVEGQKLDVTHSMDPDRLLIDKIENSWGTGADDIISSFDYAVDAARRRTDRADYMQYNQTTAPVTVDNDFSYDAFGHVEKATMGSKEYNYDYDNIGNMTTFSEKEGSATQAGEHVPNNLNLNASVKPLGESSFLTMAYDADGNMANNPASGWSYEWDAENRLSRAVKGTNAIRFHYDPFGRRIKREKSTIAADKSEELVSSTRFFYTGWKLIKEDETRFDTPSESKNTAYVWGAGLGGVGALLSVNRSGDIFYPVFDGNGNVTAYLDSTGNVEEHYNYDPFGREVTTGNTFAFRFSTKYYDENLELLLYEYRSYDPASRKWLTRDPIEEWGGVNLTGFCWNDPIGLVDLLGLLIVYDGCDKGVEKAVNYILDHPEEFGNEDPDSLYLYNQLKKLRDDLNHTVTFKPLCKGKTVASCTMNDASPTIRLNFTKSQSRSGGGRTTFFKALWHETKHAERAIRGQRKWFFWQEAGVHNGFDDEWDMFVNQEQTDFYNHKKRYKTLYDVINDSLNEEGNQGENDE